MLCHAERKASVTLFNLKNSFIALRACSQNYVPFAVADVVIVVVVVVLEYRIAVRFLLPIMV